MTIIDDLKRAIEFKIGDAVDREEFIRRVVKNYSPTSEIP